MLLMKEWDKQLSSVEALLISSASDFLNSECVTALALQEDKKKT